MHSPDSPVSPAIRAALLGLAAGLVVCLALSTLGASLWLALAVGTSLPVISAWWTLCGTLEQHEVALDALLDERAATLRTTLHTMRTQRGQRAHTGTTATRDEVR